MICLGVSLGLVLVNEEIYNAGVLGKVFLILKKRDTAKKSALQDKIQVMELEHYTVWGPFFKEKGIKLSCFFQFTKIHDQVNDCQCPLQDLGRSL